MRYAQRCNLVRGARTAAAAAATTAAAAAAVRLSPAPAAPMR